MNSLFRRGGTALAATAVTVATLALQVPAQAATYDPAPGAAGATWLTSQLTGGLVHNPNYGGFDDYGLSIDVALGLHGFGGHAATVTQISNAIASHVNSYTTGADFGAPGDQYAGATAKAVVLAETAGADPRSYGGVDLVARLEGLTSSAPTTLGRIEDHSASGDYANTIGQAFAAQGLAAVASPPSSRAADATAYLLEQQCSEGYFRLDFTKNKAAANQTCDGGKATGDSPADTDVTALAILALKAQDAAPAVSTAVSHAEAWLKAQQRANGAFGGGTATEAANSNSTGLAGWALGSLGDTTRAQRAAAWVRKHQAADFSPCTSGLTGATGAVAYDDAGLATGRRDGITDATSDQWRRASAQALPVLAWAPAASGPLTITGATSYVRGGSLQQLTVSGVARGERACLSGAGAARALSGTVRALTPSVTVPRRTVDKTYRVKSATSATVRTVLRVLGPLEVPFSLGKSSVARGGRQVVTVHGLAPGEKVRVLFRGVQVAKGRATDGGRFTARFPVTGPAGGARVKVVGQFADIRHHSKSFTVR